MSVVKVAVVLLLMAWRNDLFFVYISRAKLCSDVTTMSPLDVILMQESKRYLSHSPCIVERAILLSVPKATQKNV